MLSFALEHPFMDDMPSLAANKAMWSLETDEFVMQSV